MKQKNKPAQSVKSKHQTGLPQPAPFTPGITKGMVRQHAFELYRDKLTHDALTLQDWVLAEKDLVQAMETDNLPK